MTDQEKLQFVQGTLAELFKKTVTLTEDTLLSDLDLDSLDLVELQMYYEDQTGKVSKDPTNPLRTVKDLIGLFQD